MDDDVFEGLEPGDTCQGDPTDPDACPFCETQVQPIQSGRLEQATTGDASPEPWREIADCPTCRAALQRIPGAPWTGRVPPPR